MQYMGFINHNQHGFRPRAARKSLYAAHLYQFRGLAPPVRGLHDPVRQAVLVEALSGLRDQRDPVGNERAALALMFESLANEHAVIDDEQNVVTAMVYRDVAEKVRSRG